MANNLAGSSDFENKCWEISKTGEYYTIKLSGSPSGDQIAAFEQGLPEIYNGPTFYNVVIHCGDLGDISLPWVRSLISLQKKIQSTNKHMRLINVTPTVVAYFKQQGVDKTIPICPTLRDAMVVFGMVTKKLIDVEFINPFLTATMHVLKIQASTSSTAGKLSMKQDKTKHLGDISGVIGLVSDSFNGSVVISFPEDTFLKIMSRMLGETYTEINQEIQDGAAELTNMIFGQAKVALNSKGYGLKTAIPSVVSGKNHSVQSVTNGPQVVIPFETDVGQFYIEICTSG